MHNRTFWLHMKIGFGSILSLRHNPDFDMNNLAATLAPDLTSHMTDQPNYFTCGQEIR